MADCFTVKDLSPERKLKEYQLKKYGACFQCGEAIERNCKAVCINCGYKDSWEVVIVRQDGEDEWLKRQNTCYIRKTKQGDREW